MPCQAASFRVTVASASASASASVAASPVALPLTFSHLRFLAQQRYSPRQHAFSNSASSMNADVFGSVGQEIHFRTCARCACPQLSVLVGLSYTLAVVGIAFSLHLSLSLPACTTSALSLCMRLGCITRASTPCICIRAQLVLLVHVCMCLSV
jgi:hypothetical protein